MTVVDHVSTGAAVRRCEMLVFKATGRKSRPSIFCTMDINAESSFLNLAESFVKVMPK